MRVYAEIAITVCVGLTTDGLLVSGGGARRHDVAQYNFFC